MDQRSFQVIALTPAGVADTRLVLAADRAGCLGILNAEIGTTPYTALDALSGRTRTPYGLKITTIDDETLSRLENYVPTGLGWFVVDAALILRRPDLLARMAKSGLRVIVETIEWDDRLAALSGHHALQVKGHEAGGIVGEETSSSCCRRPWSANRRQFSCAAASGFTEWRPFALPVQQASCSTINCSF